jgi:UDP-N-acetyl-D-mannosaminuronate dehydrogenase
VKVCVIGLGYIGLPTAAMFANAGHEVLGVDKKPQIVEALNRGEIIIEENGERIRLLERRIRDLQPLLRQSRELAELTARYYERGYHRSEKYTV